jgi:hypothetical protein
MDLENHRVLSALVQAGRALSLSPPAPSDDAAGLAAALTHGLPGAPDPTSYGLGWTIGAAPHPWPGRPSSSDWQQLAGAPDLAGGEGGAHQIWPAGGVSGLVPQTSLVHDLPDLTLDQQADPAQTTPQSASAGPGAAPSRPSLYDTWTLPNGEVVRQYDAVQGPNVVYHHGDLAGAPGVYVDDPADPNHPSSVFTPTGPGVATPEHGFVPSPEIGPSGSPYYDKVVWTEGPRQALLRVDAQGNPVKAFVLDSGEADDAPSPTDFIGPGELKLALDLGLAATAKAGAPMLLKGLGAKLAASNLIGKGEEAAAEGAEAPLIQLGGAHRDVKKLTGYESHHMPAKSVSPVSTNDGPAIAMRPADHRKTASWGTAGTEYRREQARLIQNGDYRGAIQMDTDDIRSKFGSKYDDALRQMLEYVEKQGF